MRKRLFGNNAQGWIHKCLPCFQEFFLVTGWPNAHALEPKLDKPRSACATQKSGFYLQNYLVKASQILQDFINRYIKLHTKYNVDAVLEFVNNCKDCRAISI